jgi:diaminohydroxyphosphoribosylaminopyrimidine deaminase/5-amino-6-(5-phosphoribosylamino)uracil reductase
LGWETAIIDDSSLTTRLEGVADTRDPVRVVLDSCLRLPPQARMLHQRSTAETWVVCGSEASSDCEEQLVRAGARVLRLALGADGRVDLPHASLARGRGTDLVLVEGGAGIHGAIVWQRLVDELPALLCPSSSAIRERTCQRL